MNYIIECISNYHLIIKKKKKKSQRPTQEAINIDLNDVSSNCTISLSLVFNHWCFCVFIIPPHLVTNVTNYINTTSCKARPSAALLLNRGLRPLGPHRLYLTPGPSIFIRLKLVWTCLWHAWTGRYNRHRVQTFYPHPFWKNNLF